MHFELSMPAQHPLRSFWYLLLIPASICFTFVAREIAGPGLTTAPNQGAMVVFFLASITWPVIAIVIIGIIRWVTGVRGILASSLGLLAWAASCVLPFWIGMK